jgi:hypothetical protein
MAELFVGDIFAVPKRLTNAEFAFNAPDVHRTVAAALHR